MANFPPPSVQRTSDPTGNPSWLSGVDGFAIPSSKRPLKTIGVIGDSLTIFDLHPLLPPGVGAWTNVNGVSNLSANWIFTAYVDGRAPIISSSTPGVFETDGAQRLRWTYPGDAAGPWVDASLGGFFELPSGSPAVVGHSLYVAICQGNAQSAAPTTPKSDNLWTSGLPQTTKAPPYVYSGMLQAMLGPNVDCRLYGISGDKVSGVVGSRWKQAVVNNPDAVVVLIGTNDVPANGAAAATLANTMIACLKQIATRTARVYVGGIFPRADGPSLAVRQSLTIYSNMLRDFCATRPDVFRYWDAWPMLVDPASPLDGLKAGAFFSDSLHLHTYGAWIAAQPLYAMIAADFALPPLSTARGFAPYDSGSKSGAINLNPRLIYDTTASSTLGFTGTGSGANGITGNVPNSWTMQRSGSAQTCALSYVSRPDGPNAMQIVVAGGAASDYNELFQTVTLPADITAGSVIAFEFDFEILEATNLTMFQVQLNSNQGSLHAYALQPTATRPYSNFGPTTGITPRLAVRSQPMLITAGVTSFLFRLRVGNNSGVSGATATIIVRRLELIRLS